ncbi:M23 family metallopeptidase [Thermoanaerobacterium sp. DL9XJH110]|uniref:M23 family metallopeptidase n=1 Tax=Thermoanaerobacterium sp. DL9XJH110 TaxID=3386643 RepID=UPI003BB4AA54
MYYYERPWKKKLWLESTHLKKIIVCMTILIAVLMLKRFDAPFTDFLLSRINYYFFVYSYDYEDLAKAIREIPKKAEELPVFKQLGAGQFILPVAGEITSTYGMRMHPVLKVERMHNGIDIVQKEGTPVKAAMAGKVYSVEEQYELGRVVKIMHENGLMTVYAHLKDIYVKEMEPVEQGHIIGAVGKSGLAETPHLHFEVWQDGKPQDPEKWIHVPKKP